MNITSSETLDRINEMRARGEEFCVVTVVRTENATSAKAGAKALVTSDGEIHGFIGGGCVKGAVKQAAASALASGASRLIRVKPKEDVVEQMDVDGVELHKSSCPSGGTIELFIEPLLLAPRCIVFGASPVAASLIALAGAMGYRTVLAALEDDHQRVEGADMYISGFDLSEINPVAPDSVVVATQGKRDREAVQAAIGTPAHYVSMVGSSKKAAKLKTEIAKKGVSSRELDRLKCPAGMNIGAIEPEEIALSIMGEIVSARRVRARQEGAEGDDEGLDAPSTNNRGRT
ncbi:MAG: XdhC family protein [Hyphomicrobiales bacterium]